MVLFGPIAGTLQLLNTRPHLLRLTLYFAEGVALTPQSRLKLLLPNPDLLQQLLTPLLTLLQFLLGRPQLDLQQPPVCLQLLQLPVQSRLLLLLLLHDLQALLKRLGTLGGLLKVAGKIRQ
jgi:hypothetical protein